MKNWRKLSILLLVYLFLQVSFSVAGAQNLETDTVPVKLVDGWLFVSVTVGISCIIMNLIHSSVYMQRILRCWQGWIGMAIGGMRYAFYDVSVMVNPFSSNTKVGARMLEHGTLIIYPWHWMWKKRMVFQSYEH